MTTREPEWTEEDQAWILALALYRAGLCPNCGRPMRECTAAGADGKYEADLPARCHATTALLIAQAAFSNPQPAAMLWRTIHRQ